MWNRKKKRIAELEEQLADALANLVNVTVNFPEPVRVAFKAAGVRKGIWYRAEAMFLVGDDNASVGQIGIFEREPAYFDGSWPPPPETDEKVHTR